MTPNDRQNAKPSPLLAPQLREIAPYIQSLKGSLAVVLIPGELSMQPDYQSVINDLILLSSLGVRLAIVFGSRPQINQAIGQTGKYHNNVRVTSKEDMARIVELCASERLRHQKAFRVHGGGKVGVSVVWGNWISARPLGVIDGVNMGQAGAVRRIHSRAISNLLENGHIALFDIIALSPIGAAYNLVAEELALELAMQLSADKLLVYGDLGGIDIPLPARLTMSEAQQLVDKNNGRGKLTLNPAIIARMGGVKRIYLLDMRLPGAILHELLTINGAGIMLSDDDYESIGPARERDIGAILALIEPLISEGLLLPRDRAQLETSLTDFRVIRRDGVVTGCYSLKQLDDQLYEFGCLAVAPQFRRANLGRRLLADALIRTSNATLVTFTTRAGDWFVENGFSELAPTDTESTPGLSARLAANTKNSRHAHCLIFARSSHK